MGIGKRIKKLRFDKEITQEELGKIIGVSTSMVGMYETNARKPSYDVLIKIADYFEVSTDYLLGRGGYEQTSVAVGQVPAPGGPDAGMLLTGGGGTIFIPGQGIYVGGDSGERICEVPYVGAAGQVSDLRGV